MNKEIAIRELKILEGQDLRKLADKYNLIYKTVGMKTTHHLEKNEIIISDNFRWWPEND